MTVVYNSKKKLLWLYQNRMSLIKSSMILFCDIKKIVSLQYLTVTSFRWKIPAARAAEALVLRKTSVKCCTPPAPLLAITGIITASDISFTRSMSYPLPWPAQKNNYGFLQCKASKSTLLICNKQSAQDFLQLLEITLTLLEITLTDT